MTTGTLTKSTDETSFIEAIESILSSINPKYLSVTKKRYGYEDGKGSTLQEIGDKLGITRERVRQIVARELRLIKKRKRKKALRALIENIERLLLQYKGIVSINEIAKDNYFIAGTRNQLRFFINLIVALYKERYKSIDKDFLTSLNDYEMNLLESKIQKAALKCRFPIEEKNFIENIISTFGTVSNDYLTYHLFYKENIKISEGKILFPGRLSIPQQVKFLMRDINRPMHFTEIAKLYKNHFGDTEIKTLNLERVLHARISDSKDFIIVGPGTFMLKDKFRIPESIEKIVEESREILRSLKNISDTKYLLNELKKRSIYVGNLNAYSLKNILLEYPGFISYRKFEIGIEELADMYKRRPLSDLIYEILLFSPKAMHVKSIWKEISKQRGFPKYSIEQRLDDPIFIKVSTATYTVEEKIASYNEKRKIIIDFAKEWILLKENGISAFFICEVLKETEDIKDLTLRLVEHVLATSPEVIRLSNGFYDLAHKENM